MRRQHIHLHATLHTPTHTRINVEPYTTLFVLVCEQKAATTLQAATRLFMAYGRVKKLRHARRTRAQARIARAVRQRAAYLAEIQQGRMEEQDAEGRRGRLEGKGVEMVSSSSAGIVALTMVRTRDGY